MCARGGARAGGAGGMGARSHALAAFCVLQMDGGVTYVERNVTLEKGVCWLLQ